jgi:hypothetical protein
MQRMTIIKEDNMVGVDGVFYVIDCSSLPSNFHALQWYAEYNEGEEEWNGRPKPMNTTITSLENYQSFVDAWNEIDAANRAAQEAARAAAEERAAMSATTPIVEGNPSTA